MTAFDVAIIGAGAAGIAAARRLIDARRRVIVLEARDRVGGRAAVDSRFGMPLDLGAAWLHFAGDNAWTKLATEQGFTILRDRPAWGADAHIGAHAPDAKEREAARRCFEHYETLVAAAASHGRDEPVADVVPRDAFRPRFDAVMTWAVGMETHAVSTLDLDRYADSDLNWAVREGLGAVVAAAARDLPVRTGATVSAIDWSGADGVRIDCTQGRIEAAAAIVTVPTAVLAHGAIRFNPPLPGAHRHAIDNIPLGVCNKVFFPLRDERAASALLPRHFIGSASTSRTCSWQMRPAGQPVLLAYFGGELSVELERRDSLAQFARDELRGLFGADILGFIGEPLCTAWGTDPLAMGSYSAARPGYARCREALGQPASPNLHFAGEACAVNHYGTLHGAWLSGVAAAAQLLQPQEPPRRPLRV